MEDIKFRAWHKKRNCMVHFDIMTVTKTYYPGYWHTGDLDGFDCELDDPMLYSERMLYTGQKDINKVKIYSGDIVRFVEYGRNRVGEIVWDDNYGCWSVRYQFGDLDPMTIMMISQGLSDYEVIGNKWENPDIISENK